MKTHTHTHKPPKPPPPKTKPFFPPKVDCSGDEAGKARGEVVHQTIFLKKPKAIMLTFINIYSLLVLRD